MGNRMNETRGKPVVIKLGGSALPHREAVIRDLREALDAGYQPILVHGGGPVISAWLNRIGKVPEFVDGLRVTDEETLEIATMSLAGKINKELVAILQLSGTPAFGMAGADGGCVRAKRMTTPDLGFVGEVVGIDPRPLHALMDAGYVPVVAPIALGERGLLNINADTVAGDIAHATGAEILIFLTDVPGVKDISGAVRATLTRAECAALRTSGAISGGMIPKVDACLRALDGGARAAIADGSDADAIGVHLRSQATSGTVFLP
ncbi:MAG: acetylglutamate kinase [Chloroflexi bacterium]|nr:MAG: acetylglutamate kinase [Chloroflexota bacterium]